VETPASSTPIAILAKVVLFVCKDSVPIMANAVTHVGPIGIANHSGLIIVVMNAWIRCVGLGVGLIVPMIPIAFMPKRVLIVWVGDVLLEDAIKGVFLMMNV